MADSNGASHLDPMEKILAEFGSNAAYVTSLFSEFQIDPGTVSPEWRNYFERLTSNGNGYTPVLSTNASTSTLTASAQNYETSVSAKNVAPATVLPKPVASPVVTTPPAIPKPVVTESPAPVNNAQTNGTPTSNVQAVPMKGAAKKLVENMEASLTVPTATSQRQIPLKSLDENRRLINDFLTSQHLPKLSYTHIVAWAIVKTIKKFPQLNDGFSAIDGQPQRINRPSVNLGVAVDLTKSDGSRTLMVPNIKGANNLRPSEFFQEYDKVVSGARKGSLPVSAYMETTITLTNPGTIGTTASNPRLMSGQGLIIATGSIEYPAQFQGMADEALSQLGISKVCTFTSTYDHRIIQGAESGTLLSEIHKLLIGENKFYEEIFVDLRIPYQPLRWAKDHYPAHLLGHGNQEAIEKQAHVFELINNYRNRGHLIADIDPLRLPYRTHPELDMEYYGLNIWDLDRIFFCDGLNGKKRAPLREILAVLRRCYCEKVGTEYRHIQEIEERDWIRDRIEVPSPVPAPEIRKQILRKLIEAETFERFLNNKYVGQKRFSVEGCEGAVAFVDQLAERAGVRGVEHIIIGMAHRGRLNMLTNIVGDFCERILTIFEGSIHPKFSHDEGDVKYHQGAEGHRKTVTGHDLRITMASNPSHLEFVNPVVEGMAKAIQDRMGEGSEKKILPLLLHGDAAFAGEGIVAETLNLSQLEGYSTGGTVNLIINNQIGFTTSPEHSRSSLYCSDVAKIIQAPIFHVNGDDPDTTFTIMELAFDYRQRFRKDVVVDLIGYRKHGHNEADEPTYTHPVLYQKVKQHPGVRTIYAQKLISEGVVTEAEVAEMIKQANDTFEAAQARAKEVVSKQSVMKKEIACVGKFVEDSTPEMIPTGISTNTISAITRAVTDVSEGFHPNPKLKSLLSKRASMGKGESTIDWGFAEALAFGSLAVEGTRVRLSGQDCNRGTFSQRHAMYYDNEDGKAWQPLNHISPQQAPCQVYDSMLSESGVLGFEYGYSVSAPASLILWEAQFGDFVNVAQVHIDQFIVAGEEKWNQTSRLVMLLPHGYEGQGPEHSSARPERFLQLCANNNIQVCMCSTPAQYFHLLRRQMKQTLSKPLIIFTPKSLLRSPAAASHLQEFITGYFLPVIDDPITTDHNLVERVIICSGKVYYDLVAANKSHVTRIVRLEQLYPFPERELSQLIARYANAKDWVWAQEEPQNNGGWSFVQARIGKLLPNNQVLRYAGRSAAASTATGYIMTHKREEHQLVMDALGIKE